MSNTPCTNVPASQNATDWACPTGNTCIFHRIRQTELALTCCQTPTPRARCDVVVPQSCNFGLPGPWTLDNGNVYKATNTTMTGEKLATCADSKCCYPGYKCVSGQCQMIVEDLIDSQIPAPRYPFSSRPPWLAEPTGNASSTIVISSTATPTTTSSSNTSTATGLGEAQDSSKGAASATNLGAGAIAGIVVGAVLGVALFLGCFLYFRKNGCPITRNISRMEKMMEQLEQAQKGASAMGCQSVDGDGAGKDTTAYGYYDKKELDAERGEAPTYHELEGQQRSNEMMGDLRRIELHGNSQPGELAAPVSAVTVHSPSVLHPQMSSLHASVSNSEVVSPDSAHSRGPSPANQHQYLDYSGAPANGAGYPDASFGVRPRV